MKTINDYENSGRTKFITNFLNIFYPNAVTSKASLTASNDLLSITKDEILIIEIKERDAKYTNSTMLLEQKKYNALLAIKDKIALITTKPIKILYAFVFDTNNSTKVAELNQDNNYEWIDQKQQKTQCFNQNKIDKKITYINGNLYE